MAFLAASPLRGSFALVVAFGCTPGAGHVEPSRAPADAHVAAPADPGPPKPAPPSLTEANAALLAAWFAALGPRKQGEPFGDLVVRAARLQIGKPYFDPPAPSGAELLDVRLDTFQCVSLVETSLAAARCAWTGSPDATCFLREVEASRYRDGTLGTFSSKMHYFADWIVDNGRRGRVRDVTASIGGKAAKVPFFYMTKHAARYPSLTDPAELAEIGAVEARLSETLFSTIDRAGVALAEKRLQTGDIVAILGDKPGILVTHTGFAARDAQGVAHLLHASSYRGRVMLTTGDLAHYITRWPSRMGFMAARPMPPEVVAQVER